jgi:Bacterial Ig domain/Glucodextranase, domain B
MNTQSTNKRDAIRATAAVWVQKCLALLLCTVAPASDNAAIAAPPNKLPTVSITAPVNGATINAGSNLTITATARDADGAVTRVEFFRGGTTLLGTATASPYSIVWNNVPAGSYSLSAVATDNQGATKTSASVAIIATAPANNAPAVSITGPATGATFTAPASVAISASASDGDGTVTKVEFFQGATSVGVATSAPYTITWTNVASGTYTLTAKATDNLGASTTSSAISIAVGAAHRPLLTVLTSPAPCTVHDAPASMVLAADAIDPDGSVAKVEFLQGTTLLGTVTATPYLSTWSNVPAGVYTLTARATNGRGAVATSTPVTVTVRDSNQPPMISLSAPASGATYTAPATIGLAATASDPDGTVAKVEFYAGSVRLATVTAPPYAYTWTNVATGAYTLTARATDNLGAVTTCTAVNVTVQDVPPVVTITSPADGAAFVAPAAIPIRVTASAAAGTVTRLDFFDNTVPIGTLDTASATVNATFDYASVPAGTHGLTVKATGSTGLSTTTSAVTVTVNAPPPVALVLNLSAPAAGATLYESDVVVTGSFAGAIPTAITVNGQPARLGSTTFAAAVPLQPGLNLLAVVATTPAGSVSKAITVTRAEPSIALTNVTAGQTIADDTVTLIGTAHAPPNSAVIINGQLAPLAADGTFFVNNLPLAPGANDISITLNTPASGSAPTAISVGAKGAVGRPTARATPQGMRIWKAGIDSPFQLLLNRDGTAPFTLEINPAEGLAPLSVTVTLTNRLAYVYDHLTLDTNGDGVIDYGENGLPIPILRRSFSIAYDTPGLYPLTLTLTRTDGEVIYTATRMIHVRSASESADTLRSIFIGMLNRLAAGDLAGAAEYMTTTVRSRYSDAFQRLASSLPTVVEGIGTVESATFGTGYGELEVLRIRAAGVWRYRVLAIQDGDGLWRFDGM